MFFNTLKPAGKAAEKAAELSRLIWVYNSVLISHYTKRNDLMIKIIPVNTKQLQRQFVEFQYELYKDCPQFVP